MDSEAVAALRKSLEAQLREEFGSYDLDSDGDFVVRQGSAIVWIRPLDWTDGQTIVRVWSITNVDMRVEDELAEFLAGENASLAFGRFELDEAKPSVSFAHSLLGDFLNRAELTAAVRAVSETADLYDDRIKARFGGRLLSEGGGGLDPSVQAILERVVGHGGPPGARAERSRRAWQAWFGGLAFLAGIGGAIYAYSVEESVWLSIFVALIAIHLVGRGLADVVTDPNKVGRALYFLLFPALAIGILCLAYEAWGKWWLATILGIIGGAILNGLLAPRLFPRIHREETLDSEQRLAGQLGRKPAGSGATDG